VKKTVLLAALAFTVIAMAAALPAKAQAPYYFEGYAGWYVPGADELDNDWVYGVRFGGRPAPTWGWEGNLGYFDVQASAGAPTPLPGVRVFDDVNATLIEASFLYYPGGYNLAVLAGAGIGHISADYKNAAGQGENLKQTDDSFVYHLGLAYKWNIGESFYLRPDIRWRKWQGNVYEKTDNEYTLGFGWKF
jgi:opacity protein-like surface antigen